MEQIDTSENAADMFTIPLNISTFNMLVVKLNMKTFEDIND